MSDTPPAAYGTTAGSACWDSPCPNAEAESDAAASAMMKLLLDVIAFLLL
jgi:hypothetical protein